MHPAKEGFSALPFFDEFDLSTVDILLISQYVEFPYPSNISEVVGSETKREPSCPLLVYDEKLNTVQCHAPFSSILCLLYCESSRYTTNRLLSGVHSLYLGLLS